MAVEAQEIVIYVVNVYAPCSLAAKRRVWVQLKNLKQNYARGEFVVRDFNAITKADERKGRGGRSSLQEITYFSSFIVDMELFDIPVSDKKLSYICFEGI